MKNIIFYILFLTLYGCVPSNYNTPFINFDETNQLELGLSQDEIISKLGKPLFVSSGNHNHITWIYEVRTVKVKSNKTTSGQILPRKYHTDQTHDAPHHKLALKFKNGKLIEWGPFNKDN